MYILYLLPISCITKFNVVPVVFANWKSIYKNIYLKFYLYLNFQSYLQTKNVTSIFVKYIFYIKSTYILYLLPILCITGFNAQMEFHFWLQQLINLINRCYDISLKTKRNYIDVVFANWRRIYKQKSHI